jgi:nitrile hydratase
MMTIGGIFSVMAHDHDHPHDHHHDREHSELSETQLRVRALETVLTEKGYVDPAALDAIVETYETKIGPRNGARVVARAWTDPAFKKALLDDASKAIGTLGHVSRTGDHLIAVENTPQRHNMVVCTLCSCYPWEKLGLPQVWYKASPYRSRHGRQWRAQHRLAALRQGDAAARGLSRQFLLQEVAPGCRKSVDRTRHGRR